MTPHYETAHITHDTVRITDVDDAACTLFGLDRIALIDQPLSEGIHGHEMKWLAKLRLNTIRDKGEMPAQDLPFFREDGSKFWARCKTTKNTDGTFTTELTYLYEY